MTLRTFWWLSVLTALLWGTVGCSTLGEVMTQYFSTPSDTGAEGAAKGLEAGGRIFSFLGDWAPAPFNLILEGAGWAATAGAGLMTASSVKNSPEGKLLGPVRKKKEA